MKTLLLCATFISALFISPVALAQAKPPADDPTPPAEALPKFGDGTPAEMTVMHRGTDTPDGLIFQSLARRTAEGMKVDADRVLRHVKADMDFVDDEVALAFIERLSAEHRKLEGAHAESEHTFICGARPDRSKARLFRDLDALAQVQVTLALDAYDRFRATLSTEERERFAQWIETAKPGFAYYIPSARQRLAREGLDAIQHYQERCIRIGQKLEALK